MAFLPDVRWWTLPFLFSIVVGSSSSTPSPNILCPQTCQCLASIVACTRQKLRDVPDDLPSWTTELELQTNKITYLGENSLRNLDHLESLDISNNKLQNISVGAFEELERLRELKIYRNKLIHIPPIGNRLPALMDLILHHNRILNVSASDFAGLANLKKLDLSNNKISRLIPYVFAHLRGLHELNLEANRLSRIRPTVLSNLTSLKVLKLARNNINTMETFPSLPHLKVLDLDHNNLHTIQYLVFQELPNLEELSMRYNGIWKLMDGAFYGLNAIMTLDLSCNNIKMVDQVWLYGLAHLSELILSHNQINSTDQEGWKFCTSLQKLNLSHNSLETLEEEGFSELSNLRYLYLDNNRIENVEDGAFRGLNGLTTLVLRDNIISWQIEDINGAFDGLGSVQTLDMYNNSLRFLPVGALSGLDSLQKLDIRENDVTSIQENPFDDTPQLQELFLNTTTLYCDCQVGWFADWIRENSLTREVAATCSHPESLYGMDIFQLEKSLLVCEERPQPYIIQQPATTAALRGDDVSLICVAATTSNSEFTVIWKKDNKQLQDANPMNAEEHVPGKTTEFTSVLSLPSIRNENEGRYQCVFTNKFGTAYTKKAKVTVHVFPTFTQTPSDIRGKIGSSASLQCSANGQPTPEIAWRKDGGSDFPAALERRFHVYPPNSGHFFIGGLKKADMGVYSCSASNAAGTIIANATLTVLEDPHFVTQLKDQEVSVGDSAVLECNVDGSPPPTIQWLMDKEPFTPSDRHRLPSGDGGRFLIIMEVQMEDGGEYTCRASNSENVAEDTAVLTVSAKEAFPLTVTTTTGIIVIAMVFCIVCTSFIWVIVIYCTRKLRQYHTPSSSDDVSPLRTDMPSTSLNGSSEGTIHQETSSGVSSEATDKYQQENSDCDSMDDITRAFPHHGRTAAIFPSEMGIVDPPEYNSCHRRIPEEPVGNGNFQQLPHTVEIHQGPMYRSGYSQNTTIIPGEDQPFLEINELARQRHLSDQEDIPMNSIQFRRCGPSETELRPGLEENPRMDQMSISSANTYPAMPPYSRPWRDFASDEDASPHTHQSPVHFICDHNLTDSLKPPSPHKQRTRKLMATDKPISADKLQSKKCPSHRKMDSGRRIDGPNGPPSSFSTSQLPISPSTSLDVPTYHSLQRLSTSTEV